MIPEISPTRQCIIPNCFGHESFYSITGKKLGFNIIRINITKLIVSPTKRLFILLHTNQYFFVYSKESYNTYPKMIHSSIAKKLQSSATPRKKRPRSINVISPGYPPPIKSTIKAGLRRHSGREFRKSANLVARRTPKEGSVRRGRGDTDRRAHTERRRGGGAEKGRVGIERMAFTVS